MNLPEPLLVDIEWRNEAECFVVRATDVHNREVPSGVLRRQLFAWHEDSFYGSLVPEMVESRKTVLALPAALAITYLAEPSPLLHGKFTWSDSFHKLQVQAKKLQRILATGQFEPMLSLNSKDGFAWRTIGERDEDESDGDVPSLEQWLNAAMKQLVLEPGPIRDAWHVLVNQKPALGLGKRASQTFAGDEDRWLEAIGYRQDDTPFTMALRLIEPDQSEHPIWKLLPIFVDRQTGRSMFLEDIPVAWLTVAEERLARAHTQWTKVWPTLAEDLDDEAAWQFLESGAMLLRAAGITVQMPSWWESLLVTKPKLVADVRMNEASGLFGMQQLLDYDWRIAIGEVEISEQEFQTLVKSGQKLTNLNGKWVALQPKWVKSLQATMREHTDAGQNMRLSEVLALHLADGQRIALTPEDENQSEIESFKLEVRLQQRLQQWTAQLFERSAMEQFHLPATFMGELRPYQAEGAAWLGFLRQSGLGACLADDMGLGKTVQFIAHIAHLKQTQQMNNPVLLICPTSVLGNWQQEWRRFAPSVKTYLHYGTNRLSGETFFEEIAGMDVIITSYSLALLDQATLGDMEWTTICLDEAQNIKNPAGKQSQAIRRLRAQHRVALTGTPIENRLLELWSIFDFLNPGYLGSMRAFHRSFVKPIERNKDEETLARLQRLVRPFLLRRTKKDEHIQLSLPDKLEQHIFVSLTAEQAVLYEQQLEKLLNGIDRLSAMERRGQILAVLTKLKQICDHPSLFEGENSEPTDEWIKRSNKLARLLEMIDEARAENQRCIIFTQYVRMGRMIAAALENRFGKKVSFLHGGVAKEERDRLVAAFQAEAIEGEESSDIFILSLKAGGTGLNLTAATHVFHFDRWWNPAVENQATDRAYRIGQTKQVQVHKFVSLGTLEERIHEMIARKQALSENIVGAGESWITEMSTDEIKDLFRLRREWLEEEEV